jgi:hypothetical protein
MKSISKILFVVLFGCLIFVVGCSSSGVGKGDLTWSKVNEKIVQLEKAKAETFKMLQ